MSQALSHSLDIHDMICVGIDRKCRLIYCYLTGQPIRLPDTQFAANDWPLGVVCPFVFDAWVFIRPFSKPSSLLILSAVAALACTVLVAWGRHLIGSRCQRPWRIYAAFVSITAKARRQSTQTYPNVAPDAPMYWPRVRMMPWDPAPYRKMLTVPIKVLTRESCANGAPCNYPLPKMKPIITPTAINWP